MSRDRYEIEILHELIGDSADANADVVVEFASGRRFTGTFFTLANLQSLLKRYEQTGECAGGLYVWAVDMIIVRELTPSAIRCAIADLLESGEFETAFGEIPPD